MIKGDMNYFYIRKCLYNISLAVEKLTDDVITPSYAKEHLQNALKLLDEVKGKEVTLT